MKNLLSIFCMLCVAPLAFAQSSTGLIAHWDFNGGASDISGNGHTGHLHSVTPTTGIDGLPNTAYYFDGVNSYISASYAPDLNISTNNLTMCAIVKVTGFYSGTCQSNMILTRGNGSNHDLASYNLSFDDNPFDSSCTNLDTTLEVFYNSAYNLTPPSYAATQYRPTIVENRWYKIVATFDDTVYKVFINDTLRSLFYSTSPGMPIGSSTDSLSIGNSIYGAAAGWPYNFKGVIDDIRIYNRVLNDSEVAHYGDSCGSITVQPITSTTNVGRTATFSVHTTIARATYQWQQDGGTGFVNLTNSGPYSGVTTNTLTVSPVTAGIAGDHYRCVINNSWGCADTTAQALLTTGIDNLQNDNEILVFPIPAKNKITIQLPSNKGTIQLFNEFGQSIYLVATTEKESDIDLSVLPSGIYFLKIDCDGIITNKKVTKY